MIRLGGEDEHKQRFILLVLEPTNVERLVNGEPLLVALQHLAEPGVITEEVNLVIEVPEDFEARKRELLQAAQKNNAPIRTIPQPATGTM